MNTLTLVTAYFNIGRDSWSGFNRNDEKYLSFFSHWARLKNNLIIYTSPDLSEHVSAIRDAFNLKKNTTIIPIEDVTKCAPLLYTQIKTAMSQKESWLFHKKLTSPESWSYHYNYITNLKPFWVYDATQRGLTSDMVAWIDFGYDHGGAEFPHSEDFDFLWEYPFEPLIHIFLSQKLDNKPIFKIIQDMDTYIRGGITVAPAPLWELIWKETQYAIQVLSECGLSDDDQTLMLMIYRRYPNLFKPHMTTYWGEALHAYGGNKLHLSLSKSKNHNFSKKIKRYMNLKKEEWDIFRRHGKEIEEKYFK